MKKNLIYTVMITVAIVLSACGSNSKQDPIIIAGDDTQVSVGGFEFINFPKELNITEYKRYKIDFQLAKNGIPQEGATVAIKVFDKRYGTIASHNGSLITEPGDSLGSQVVQTDKDGIGRFLYTPPAIVPAEGSSYTLEIAFEGTDVNQTLVAKVKLMFNLNASASDGRATTLSIAYGIKPPKGYEPPEGGDSPDLGTGDRHEPGQWDGEQSKIINYYAVHAVDESARRPMVGLPIRMSMINGVRILNGTNVQDGTGIIESTDPTSFVDNNVNFMNTVGTNDQLIVLPSQGRIEPSYLGGWPIEKVNGNRLILEGNYDNLESIDQLTYIIGNERRLLGRNIVVADVEHIDLESITDEYGMAYLKVTFDPELAGHTATLEAHSIENGKRIGISRIVTLRWDKFSAGEQKVVNSGAIETVVMTLSIDTPNGGSEHLIDMDIVPSSFVVEKSPHCSLNQSQSNFHTSPGGQVLLAINTDGNVTAAIECTIKWNGSAGSMYYEY